MAYSHFDLSKVQTDFELVLQEDQSLFPDLTPCEPSPLLQQILQEYQSLALAINSEKARSEFIIAPILGDIRRQVSQPMSLFSGKEFNVDTALGLNGYCDFILSKSKEQFFIQAPVFAIIEAKNEDIVAGLGQCAAAMVAAQKFNKQHQQQQKQGEIDTIYGCVTTGSNWRFLSLVERQLQIDKEEYYLKELSTILGIFILPFRTP
jgi:hypothetical protein